MLGRVLPEVGRVWVAGRRKVESYLDEAEVNRRRSPT